MAGAPWIKCYTDMFNHPKIKYLRRLPDGNNIALLWIMLLTMAGRCNAGGMIFLTENIPYTSKTLADELDFEENTVKLGIQATAISVRPTVRFRSLTAVRPPKSMPRWLTSRIGLLSRSRWGMYALVGSGTRGLSLTDTGLDLAIYFASFLLL